MSRVPSRSPARPEAGGAGAAAPPRAAQRILATADALFYREGSRAVGVDEIVVRAGATKPSLYRAYPSKDHLIAATLEGRAAAAWAVLDTAAAQHPDDPKAQLLAWMEAMAAATSQSGYRGCALTNAVVEYPQGRHPARKAAVAHKQAVRDRLRDLTRTMGARKPKKLADALLLLAEGLAVTAQIFGEDGPAGAARGAAEALISAHARDAVPPAR